jgi:hypothetical protein
VPRTPKFNVGKEKLSAQCEPCELPVTPFNVKVRFCVFFDGTRNNKFNTNKGRLPGQTPDPNSSYGSDYTNVARLSNCFEFYKKKYDIQFAMYVVGAGTGGNEQDVTIWGKGISNEGARDGQNRQNHLGSTADTNVFGAGFAWFATGILERSRLAFFRARDEIARRIKVFRKKKKIAASAKANITSVEIDAFGFSRGAATARNFVARVLDGWEGGLFDTSHKNFSYFLAQLKNVQSEGRVKFVFLGLYDTVASHGAIHSNDVSSLKLDRLNRVERVVHLCAADEHRKNFALTNIRSAGSRGVEIFLPGCHADIGGGYRNGPGDEAIWLFYRPVRFKERITEMFYKYLFQCIPPGTTGGNHTWEETHPRPLSFGEFYNKKCSAGWSVQIKRNWEEVIHGNWNEVDSWVKTNRQIYDKEQLWLEQSGWYPGQLERPQTELIDGPGPGNPVGPWISGLELKGIISKRRSISNRFSFITLRMMADFARDPRWGLKFNSGNIDQIHSVDGDALLRQVRVALESYVIAKCNAPIPLSVGVGTSSWRDWFSYPEPCDKSSQYPWLARLRMGYLHFSAHIENGVVGVNDPWFVGERRQRPWFNG